jgi:hypothetical protein
MKEPPVKSHFHDSTTVAEIRRLADTTFERHAGKPEADLETLRRQQDQLRRLAEAEASSIRAEAGR